LQYYYHFIPQAEPTVKAHAAFRANDDSTILRGAMKGFGTDEQTIINILTSRTNEQRQAIAKAFAKDYGRVSEIF
jgi:annexin A7/11